MSTYSAFFMDFSFFYRCVFAFPNEEHIIPLDSLEMAKKWKAISKDVFEGKNDYDIGAGETITFNDLTNCLTLMDSKESDRVLVLDSPSHGSKLHTLISKKPPTKVCWLRRNTHGNNLEVTVLSCMVLFEKGQARNPMRRLNRYLVGDETGSVFFIARDEQVDVLKVGMKIRVLHGRIEDFNDEIFLSVGRYGFIEPLDAPLV